MNKNVRVGGYYGDYDDDDDFGKALVGGMIGAGIGNLLTQDQGQ